MKKIIASIAIVAIALLTIPSSTLAAAGIFASGGGTKTVGQTFTVTVSASGGDFNAFQGSISISGPVSVVSFDAGSADTWMSKPSNGGTFAGALLGRTSSSLTIASIKLKGNNAGSGSVSVSGVVLKNGASTVSNSGNSASFTIQKAPELPGAVEVTSASHPDQNAAYEATTIVLAWNKQSGVDGFSYLLDQAADTTPAAKISDANTTVTYDGKAVGTYYFHIKAHKSDGWGPVTHFKVNIKEPDPKINDMLRKPANIKIERMSSSINDVVKGEFTGIRISGLTESSYTANIVLTPAPTIPEGKSLSTIAKPDGSFELIIDYPLKAGFYNLTVQGQKEKVLTPISDKINFEISLKLGGSINIISEADSKLPVVKVTPQVKGSFLKQQYPVMTYLVFTLSLVVLLFGALKLTSFIRKRRVR